MACLSCTSTPYHDAASVPAARLSPALRRPGAGTLPHNTTIVISGHGKPVSNKAELLVYRDMLVAIRENGAKLKREGRSPDETIGARPTEAFDAKWGQIVVSPAFFTKLVYEGV